MFTTMIVDDEKWVRAALRYTIEESGIPVQVVRECEDGREALTWLQENRVDLVFADIRMPELDGLALIRALREHGSEQDVILITAHDDFHFVQEALRLGVMDYLLKPVQAEDITACFQKWLKRRRVNTEALVRSGKRPDIIDKVIRFIEVTPMASINLAEAAKHVHLTPSYLSALFKQHMNMNFVEYFTGYRMREAKKLLRSTSMPVAEIAERLAYADIAYFSNTFKKETGNSPSEYRQNYKEIDAGRSEGREQKGHKQ